jgi:hypothetical protein
MGFMKRDQFPSVWSKVTSIANKRRSTSSALKVWAVQPTLGTSDLQHCCTLIFLESIQMQGPNEDVDNVYASQAYPCQGS